MLEIKVGRHDTMMFLVIPTDSSSSGCGDLPLLLPVGSFNRSH